MKNIKKGVGKIAAVGLISMLSLGGLSSVAFADELSHTDPQTHKNSMTIGGGISVVNHNDINNDGLVNAGDTLSLNLHIENTSDNDYNYVDASSFGLGLNREFVSDSLPAGESVDFPITYNIKAGDELSDTVSHNVFVNVRDETRIENSTSVNFSENIDMNEDAVVMPNSKLTGLIMDKASGNIVVESIDEYDNYYGIDESRLTEGYHTISVGDGYVYAFDFTNETDEAITLESIDYVNNIIEENVSGTVVEPGETANLYAISEITRDDMDWGLVNSKATVGGSFDIVVSDTNNVNYSISNGKTTNRTTSPHLINWGNSNVEDLGGTAESNIVYKFIAGTDAATVIVDGINSERFGFIESSHVLENEDEITVEAPETIVLESGDSYTENAFSVYRGKYHSEGLTLNSMEITGSYESNTGGGLGDEWDDPYMTTPVCGEEAQVVIPDDINVGEANEYNYTSVREGNTITVSISDANAVWEEWVFEIPAVVPCPVEIPDYEEPVFNAPTCDSSASLRLPQSNEFYTYSSAGSETADGVGVLTAEVRNTETDELVDSWKFEYTNPTDCDPVVEIPDYEVPTFVPGTCDTDYVLNVPEDTEYYKYSSSRVYATGVPTAVFGVKVYNAETDEVLDTWDFEYVIPTDCDPVEEETPEPPVEEVVPPVVEEKPETPVKEVPKKVNSGEVSEIVVEDNNVAVFALIAGAGVVVALTTGIVLVRSRKK